MRHGRRCSVLHYCAPSIFNPGQMKGLALSSRGAGCGPVPAFPCESPRQSFIFTQSFVQLTNMHFLLLSHCESADVQLVLPLLTQSLQALACRRWLFAVECSAQGRPSWRFRLCKRPQSPMRHQEKEALRETRPKCAL